MSVIEKIEIDNTIIGIVSSDNERSGFRFYSSVAPYDLLDGSRFSELVDAYQAVRRVRNAAIPATQPARTRS